MKTQYGRAIIFNDNLEDDYIHDQMVIDAVDNMVELGFEDYDLTVSTIYKYFDCEMNCNVKKVNWLAIVEC